MTPIEFPEQTTVVAKDQPEYLPLPAHIGHGPEGAVTSCWKMNWRERLQILFTGKVWVSLWCFHKPVTPSKISAFKSDFDLSPHPIYSE
jgi:hypothetical protein